jgi:hypothetical protein
MQDIREEIAHVATDLYLKSGMQPGHDLDNWLAAEKLVFSWHEPDAEREKHVGENSPAPVEHVIPPSQDQIKG